MYIVFTASLAKKASLQQPLFGQFWGIDFGLLCGFTTLAVVLASKTLEDRRIALYVRIYNILCISIHDKNNN